MVHIKYAWIKYGRAVRSWKKGTQYAGWSSWDAAQKVGKKKAGK
jgi:hypothetical protein